MKFSTAAAVLISTLFSVAKGQYTYPAEDTIVHEATWLQWPHNYGWDPNHQQRYEPIWIAMTQALHTGELVRIICYDNDHCDGIADTLAANGVNLEMVEMFIAPSDDVWARDTMGIFVFDASGNKHIEDWGFNGWGNDSEWENDDLIPTSIAADLGMTPIDVSQMVNEGGSIEVDGRGTLMAKRSSILNDNRNPGMTQAQAEAIFSQYLGVTNFIWVDGTPGIDITDDHIDGDARFALDNTIVLHERRLMEPSEYDIFTNATDVNGDFYNIVELPKTSQNLAELNGQPGVYMNYYVGNDVIIFPIFNDPNDSVAANIIQQLYPTKQLHQIVFTELYKDGGIAHCVTMQEPAAGQARVGNVRTGGRVKTRAHHSKHWARTNRNYHKHERAHKVPDNDNW